jgi:hypothetical protein
MKRLLIGLVLAAVTLTTVVPPEVWAARRVVVRHRGRRTVVVVHRGHPLRRVVRRTVIVRPARRVVVVTAPIVFLPAVVWAAAVVALPERDYLVWEDSETIAKDEDWVECNFGVDTRGEALFVEVAGKVQLDFAEVTYGNGEVQVVDFAEKARGAGLYKLHDFRDGRHVSTVRVVARAKSDEATLKLSMKK